MRDFRHLIFSALCSGLSAGLILSIIQYYTVIPLILEAESFELGRHVENDFERARLTFLANSLAGIGFALILSAANYVHGQYSVVKGLLWGGAGYLVFFVAPALGLPPELPGTAAAALEQRQAWWLITIIASASGLALLCFNRTLLIQLFAIVLIVSPHLYGAPQPVVTDSLAGEQLEHQFIITTTIVNAIFWLTLGAISGYLLNRHILE